VQCGDQAAADPDANDLVDFAHGIRRYRDGLCKRLVGGRWESTLEEETPAMNELNDG